MTNPLLANRRTFLHGGASSVGAAALSSLLSRSATATPHTPAPTAESHTPALPHFEPKAKRVIYLFQSGGPAQHDLFDHKPLLVSQHGKELPESVRGGQRLTGMSANQSSLPLAGSQFKFQQHGESGAWLSELMPPPRKDC